MTPINAADLDILRRTLGTPDLAWLLARMRTRLESTGQLTGTVTKPQSSAGERAAVARLLNRPVRAGTSASVSLDTLDDVLRRSGTWPAGLAAAVVALTGTVVDPVERAGERDAWQAAANTLRRLGRPELSGWADRVIRTGALRRAAPTAAAAQALAAQLATVAAALPTSGESLGGFAARTVHDAHALDAHTQLGALAVGLASALGAALAGASSAASSPTAPSNAAPSSTAPSSAAPSNAAPSNAAPSSAAPSNSAPTDASAESARWRREAWQSVGVVLDELSSSVLVLGLPGGVESPTARALAALGDAGQPVVLTLRQLLADGIGIVPSVVFVCENPAVVAAAADALGPDSAPLVCLNGQPGAAAILLLEALVAGGATLRFHGDFDWSGIGVARALGERVAWTPWRFAAADYSAACAELSGLPPLLVLPGVSAASVETPWDADLAEAMASVALAVDEELMLPGLLADLAR
ncbi:TIGR02679 family protein [Cryobacterium frigoriphilum]|uniref:TIGR02679 family protein n=1 Tax=Cryobacterium frigoriphilum TaxID=1259150 RepID=A0A4V3IS49_9MICO|nr:TIGR02679 family protein [Cryobacterium frigoriphilum]TFD54729.1 TIGR02679 family protein [Cryobacterium frigoriphilum]